MTTSMTGDDTRKRRHFTLEEKYQIFLEAVTAERNGGIGEVIRKYGIHSSDLQRIRRTVEEGAVTAFKEKKSRKPEVSFKAHREKKEEVKNLERVVLEQAAEIALLKKSIRSNSRKAEEVYTLFPGSRKNRSRRLQIYGQRVM